MKRNTQFANFQNKDISDKVHDKNAGLDIPINDVFTITTQQNRNQLTGKARIERIFQQLKIFIRKLTKNPQNLMTLDKFIREIENSIEQQIQQTIRSSPNQKYIRQNIDKSKPSQAKLKLKGITAPTAKPSAVRISPNKINAKLDFIDSESPLLKKINKLKTEIKNQDSFEFNPQNANKNPFYGIPMLHKKDILAATFTNGKINNPIGGIYSKTLIESAELGSPLLDSPKKRDRRKKSNLINNEEIQR